jgi:hypothetical protein
MVIRPKSIANVVLVFRSTAVGRIDPRRWLAQVLLGSQRSDLADRAHQRGLARAEPARDKNLDCHGATGDGLWASESA